MNIKKVKSDAPLGRSLCSFTHTALSADLLRSTLVHITLLTPLTNSNGKLAYSLHSLPLRSVIMLLTELMRMMVIVVFDKSETLKR